MICIIHTSLIYIIISIISGSCIIWCIGCTICITNIVIFSIIVMIVTILSICISGICIVLWVCDVLILCCVLLKY